MNHDGLNLASDSGFGAQEIADCMARQGLLAMAIELSPVLPKSPIADTLGLDKPEPAELSFEEVRGVIRQAHELGARRIMLLRDPASSSLEPKVLAFVRELEMELEACPRHLGQTRVACGLKTSPTGQGCMRHRYSCVVSMLGLVYPCVGVLISLGDVRDESLRNILGRSEVIENLSNHRERIKEPCRDCRDVEDCYGCRGAAFAATGDYLAPDPTCPRAEGVAIDSLPVVATPLIPHGATVQMIDRLTLVGERQAMAEYVVPDTCPFIDTDGRLDATAYVELIAQTMAAYQGFHLSIEERSQQRGLLLGVRDLRATGESHVGDHLTTHVRKTTRFGDFGVVEGVVYQRDGREVARGELKVWQGNTDSDAVLG